MFNHRLVSILILLPLLFLIPKAAYPIPVDCRNMPHLATSATASISQPFGHFGHVGIDYDMQTRTPVFAVMDSIVIQVVGDSRVYGRYVMLLHCDGYASLYAHLSRIDVKFGEIVQAGQVIGLSGGVAGADGSGQSSGAHLHFEVRIPGHLDNNLYNIDPLIYAEMRSREITIDSHNYSHFKELLAEAK